MNLFWLRYVSYIFVAVAAILYFAVRLNRLNRLAMARGQAILLYAFCIGLACLAWHAQASNMQHSSPRKLILGSAINVKESPHRGGSISDEFQLKLGGGALSPVLSTEIVGDSAAHQPIHQGDVLGVLYRTWDNVPLTIDVLQGQQTGWHYNYPYDGGAPFIAGAMVAGAVGLIGIYASSRNRQPQADAGIA